jgi:hypothetical protein
MVAHVTNVFLQESLPSTILKSLYRVTFKQVALSHGLLHNLLIAGRYLTHDNLFGPLDDLLLLLEGRGTIVEDLLDRSEVHIRHYKEEGFQVHRHRDVEHQNTVHAIHNEFVEQLE